MSSTGRIVTHTGDSPALSTPSLPLIQQSQKCFLRPYRSWSPSRRPASQLDASRQVETLCAGRTHQHRGVTSAFKK